VVRSPQPDEPAHCDLVGKKSAGVLKRIRDACSWVIKPPANVVRDRMLAESSKTSDGVPILQKLGNRNPYELLQPSLDPHPLPLISCFCFTISTMSVALLDEQDTSNAVPSAVSCTSTGAAFRMHRSSAFSPWRKSVRWRPRCSARSANFHLAVQAYFRPIGHLELARAFGCSGTPSCAATGKSIVRNGVEAEIG
jgi:hypothetical protein